VRLKNKAFRLEGLLNFYADTHNAANLPSGMFLIAFCMFQFSHHFGACLSGRQAKIKGQAISTKNSSEIVVHKF